MSIAIDRRLLLKLGTLGLAALPTPGMAAMLNQRGFTHSVASGEPGPRSVLLWTRYVTADGASLRAEISDTLDFARVVAGGETMASPARDGIAKLTVAGLEPGRWYYYRFVAPDGAMSPIGRTRTLPEGETDRFNLAVFSCSNLPFGWFNAYGHAAERGDIDLIVHLGDYIYEYQVGNYPGPDDRLAGREIDPANEIVSLNDYRLRYAAYRRDPDLQRLHQAFPMVAQWDDHELANDAWMDGAQNHQSDTEGPWPVRRAAAEQVRREWMPVSDVAGAPGRIASYQIGNLATLIKTESRITGRVEQLETAAAIRGEADPVAALAAFRDGPWQDTARTMLGLDQETWFADQLAASGRSGTRWQIWAQQCIIGNFRLPLDAGKWIPDTAPDYVQTRVKAGVAASRAGLPANLDAWDGYPAARRRALSSVLDADANLVVLTGDSHNGWAFDLDMDGTPAGVELAGQSVSSPGFESYTNGVDPAELATALRTRNPGLKWADTAHRGYLSVAMTPDRVRSTWHLLDTIRQRSTALAGENVMTVTHGRRRFDA